MSSPTINFFPYFSPPPPASHLPPPSPPHSVSPPPPPQPRPVGPPPKPQPHPTVPPPPPPQPRPVGPPPKPQPHPIVPPPPPHHVLPPPKPHPFAPPPSHLQPPPSPLRPPPSPDHHHPTVIIIIFVSCGGLFFLAFMAAALFCCLKKRKKKTVQKAEIIRFDEHRRVKEETDRTGAVILTVEDDVHIEEKVKKSENVLESSNLGAKVAEHHKHGHNKSVKETEILEFDEHRKIKEKIVEGPHGSEVVVLSVEDDVHIEEKMKKNEKVGENLGAKETAGSSS